eukprot:gene11938-13913_t
MAKEKKPVISDLLKKMLEPQEVIVSRYRTNEGVPKLEALKEALQRGYLLVRFPRMFGGSELGVSLTKTSPKDTWGFEWTPDDF